MNALIYALIEGYDRWGELPQNVKNRVENALKTASDGDKAAACKEIEWCRKNNVEILCYGTPEYPRRMLNVPCSPLALFYRGTANLNAAHVVSIVGTRHITNYGKELCARICKEISELRKDVVIVSGLAYGVDIHSHRAALDCGLETIGVVGHGLDRIYPSLHRDTAMRMADHGGILSQFVTGTQPYAGNFVKRNRIVATISDATIVIESASKGGSLITAGMAKDARRALYACPGRIGDTQHEGCNLLISSGEAQILTSISHMFEQLNWRPQNVMPINEEDGNLTDESLSPEEISILKCLNEENELTVDQLTIRTKLPAYRIAAILMDLEMQGVVNVLPGGKYAK